MAQIIPEQEAEVLPPTVTTGAWDADDRGKFFTRQPEGGRVVWGYGAHVFPQGYELVFETTLTNGNSGEDLVIAGKWVDLHATGESGHGPVTFTVQQDPPRPQNPSRPYMTPDQAALDNGFPATRITYSQSNIAPHIPPDSAPRLHSPSVEDISGYWNGNDNGLYLVRQINNEIWWRGIGNDGSFSNVYSATRNGNSISGTWADVTVGSTRNQGQLMLQIVMLPGSPTPLLQRTRESGGFGGSIWLPLRSV